jgi:hypothetical protein
VIVKRTLAVLSAALLVGAVALATFGSRMLSLNQALGMLDRELVLRLHGWIEAHLGQWVWTELAMPLLVRPVWLLPVALGLICAGASFSLGLSKSARRSHRRS